MTRRAALGMALTAASLARLVRANERDGGLSADFAHRGLGDADMGSVLDAVEAAAAAHKARGPGECALSLVLEMNFFGDAGIALLVEVRGG